MPPDDAEYNTGRFFYRRVHPDQWYDFEKRIPKEELFHMTEADTRGIPPGLSVFDADVATPLNTLEHLLGFWRARNRKKLLDMCDDCVEGLIKVHWGVLMIPEAAFRIGNLMPHPDIDDYGHLVIQGNPLDFIQYAPFLADKAINALAANFSLPVSV